MEDVNKSNASIEQLTLENNLLNQRVLDLEMELQHQKKINASFLNSRARNIADSSATFESFSYQLGHLIVTAFKKPGKNTLLLPFRIIKLIIKKI